MVNRLRQIKRNHSTNLTLSQTTNFRLVQIQRGCRRQFQFFLKWQKALQTGRKHCGNRRNCSLRAISPFPTVFSKELYCRHVKTRACLGQGYVTCITGLSSEPVVAQALIKSVCWKEKDREGCRYGKCEIV